MAAILCGIKVAVMEEFRILEQAEKVHAVELSIEGGSELHDGLVNRDTDLV